MPGLVKIGYTERTMDERLQEANQSTWVPQAFSIEFAKFVKEPNAKEQSIHRILAADRVNPKREFFRSSVVTVRMLFELMDGPWWDPEVEEGVEPLSGSQVVTLFLNTFVHPIRPGDAPATSGGVASEFKSWKAREGHKYGKEVDVIDKLRSQLGNPKPGVGWPDITLRVPSKTDA